MQKGKPNVYNVQSVFIPRCNKSLNREQRRRNLIKITQENQAILKRLQAKNATYSVEKWEKDFANSTQYRFNVS